MNKKILFLNFIIYLFLIAGCSTIKRGKAWIPAFYNLKRISHTIYVNKEIQQSKRDEIIGIAKEAENKMKLFFGKLQSSPTIIVCSTNESYKSFGGIGRGMSLAGTKVILSPKALTVPLLTHEWTHAELYIRVGGFFKLKNLPQWFNDGIAVMISDEPSHSEEIWNKIVKNQIKTPSLNELKTLKQWNSCYKRYEDTSINPEHLNVVYATAGHEIRNWYKKAGIGGLKFVIHAVKEGHDFNKAYNRFK